MTTFHPHSRRRPWVLLPAAALGLALAAPIAQAAPADELLKRAEAACLDSAARQGWQRELSQVVSSRQISADRVEVVFDLSRDGSNTARLTCPFSGSQGVIGQLAGGAAKLATDAGSSAASITGGAVNSAASITGGAVNSAANLAGSAVSGAGKLAGSAASSAGGTASTAQDYGKDFAESMATTAGEAGQRVQRSRAWWLLLPVGLAALCWAALRRRDRSGGGVVFDDHYGSAPGSRTADAFVAEAFNDDPLGDGMVTVHEDSDRGSAVRRRIPAGDHISLTGRRIDDWMEVDGGGWVRQRHLRVGGAAVMAGRRDG